MGYATVRQLAGGGPAVLAALVPSLPDVSLAAAEAAARNLRPADRAAALLALRARLDTTRLDDEILAAARAAGDRAPSLALDWAAGAAPAARGPVLLEAVRAADDWERATLLASAVVLADADGLAALLGECRRVDGDELPEVIAAFARRADELPPDVRAGVMDLVGRGRGRAARVAREAAALPLLDARGRERVVGAAMRAWAGEGPDGAWWLGTVAAWPPEARIQAALDAVADMEGDLGVEELLDALAPDEVLAVYERLVARPARKVPREGLEAVLARLPAAARPAAVAWVEGRFHGARRVAGLVALARGDAAVLREGLTPAALGGAAEAAAAGGAAEAADLGGAAEAAARDDDWLRAIGELAPDVPAPVVPFAVDAARRSDDPRLRIGTLALLARLADEPLRSGVVDEVIAGLAATPRALDLVAIDALSMAASPEQATAALASVRARRRGWDRDAAVSTLAGALDDGRLLALVAELAVRQPLLALELVERYGSSLAPGSRPRALAATEGFRARGDRAIARAELLAAGEPPEPGLATATLDLALEADEDAASRVISRLAAWLPAARTLEIVLRFRDPANRFIALAAIVEVLPAGGELAARAQEALDAEDARAGGGGLGAGDGDAGGQAVAQDDAARALDALFPAGAPGHLAYGLLDAPAEVVVALPFTLKVGIAAAPPAGVAGPPLRLPPVSDTPYLLDVRIAAPGFTTPPGESRRRSLIVSRDDPYPSTTVTLVPKPVAGGSGARPITAEFWVAGERLGDAIRYVEVAATVAVRSRPAEERVEAGVNVAAPTGTDVPDLTISIRRSYPAGRTEWTLDSPHRDAVTPNDEPFVGELEGAAAFLLASIGQIDAADGKKAVFGDVLALANRVSGCIPDEVWTAIRAAATAAGGPPTILLACEEPHVPWELARVDPPLLAGGALPPFLAAQARVARWVLATRMVDGRTRPPVDPPRRKQIASTAVVAGSYSGTRWENLAHARLEAKELRARFGAVQVKPTNEAMFELLKGTPAADLLHFAVHGRYNPEDPGAESGIILVDGESLHAGEIAARDLATHPVVFLNACQLAAGQLELGAYSGVAAAFVEAGASAVVAPLWRVDDGIARDIALDFYDRIAAGAPLSEVLRHAREQFTDSVDTTSATWMAYQLFAHPAFAVDGLPAGRPLDP